MLVLSNVNSLSEVSEKSKLNTIMSVDLGSTVTNPAFPQKNQC